MLSRDAKSMAISEALGYSSVAFTMGAYSHIIEGMQQDVMALLDEVLPSGKIRSPEEVSSRNRRDVQRFSFSAPVAQRIEQRFPKPRVGRSSRPRGTIVS